MAAAVMGARAVTINIADCGAVGDGKTINTRAIQTAIDRCAAQGGGTVLMPKGIFLSGSIFLRQNIRLEIGRGAVLLGSQDTNDYPWIATRIAGLEMKWPAALVNAQNANNVAITGGGTVDGNGLPWWKAYWAARAQEEDGTDPHFKVPRPRLIHFFGATNVTVAGPLLRNSPFWTLQLTYCDTVLVSNVTIRNPHSPIHAASSDGIDIDSSRNVIVDGCDIVCDDDGICLKSGRDADGLRVNRPTENVVIRNCRVGFSSGMVVFGSETSGGIRHVRVSNCRADDGCAAVVRFKTKMDRGGTVEDVVYDNIDADDVQSVFNFNMNAHSKTWLPAAFRAMPPPDKGTPVFRDITVRHLQARNCQAAGGITGVRAIPVQNMTVEEVQIEAEDDRFAIRNAPGLRLADFTVNGKPITTPEAQ